MAIHTDYKFKHISRDGQTTKCKVVFYEGDYVIEPRTDDRTGVVTNVRRYRRAGVLRTEEPSFAGDFTNDELRTKINHELAKDGSRLSIPEQKNA